MSNTRSIFRHLAIFWFVVPFAIVGAIDAPVQAQSGQDEVEDDVEDRRIARRGDLE